MTMEIRKNSRLSEYDYSSVGSYFITVCVKDKQRIFWNNNVGADIIRPLDKSLLSHYGLISDKVINDIPNHS